MKASRLTDYVPAWPAYHARRIDDAVLIHADGYEVSLAAHNLAAYRIRTRLAGREASVILPVPLEHPAPLADPATAEALAEAFHGQ